MKKKYMPRIQARTTTLSSIIQDMKSRGTIRIPHFQREYVWERTRVAKLFDSIYQSYPIGSFFIWITPPEYRNLYREITDLQFPEPAGHDQIKMILDGQQRLTSLYVVANGIQIAHDGGLPRDYKKICFNLDTEEFVVSPRGEDKEKIVSVWRFFNGEGEDEIIDSLSNERREIFRQCRRRLSDYPISVIEVEEVDLDGAVDIFERINQGGKKLNLFDLVVASTWSRDFDLKEAVKKENKKFKEIGFGEIDSVVYGQLLALIIKGQCTKIFQLQLKNSEIKEVWSEVVRSLSLAVDYLRQNFGVKIYSFTPYPSMIALAAYLFYKTEGRSLTPEQAKFFELWFWRAALSQRYSSATLSKMGDDRKLYFDMILSGAETVPEYAIGLSLEDIRSLKINTRSAIKNTIFCLLATKEPKHFRIGSAISLDNALCSSFNQSEKHHIFPNAYLREQGIGERHLVVNFAFIPAELNNAISDTGPAEYFSGFKNDFSGNYDEIFLSHLIPNSESLWKEDFQKFLVERSEIIFQELMKKAGKVSRIESLIDDDSIAVVHELEVKMRDSIDQNLRIEYGENYWSKGIPGAVNESIIKKIERQKRKSPHYFIEENRLKLDYLDFSEYLTIFLINWKMFEKYFITKENLSKHLSHVSEFRNSQMHAREIDSVTKKMGEASIEWMWNALDPKKAPRDLPQNDVESFSDEEYFCNYKNLRATGIPLSDGSFKVFQDSEAVLQEAPSFESYKKQRQALIDKGILIRDIDKLCFTVDYIFSSPSAAASVVLGRGANGKTEWKKSTGEVLGS